MKPLTLRMVEVIRAFDVKGDHVEAMTANAIAYACGFYTGQDKNRHAHDGRRMAPAQRVIFPLTALRARGLVGFAERPDRLSGTAHTLTRAGIDAWYEISKTWGKR